MSTLYFDAGPSASWKVMLATTAYEGVDAGYAFAIARSREALSVAGIASAYLILQGNCHVDDARNTVVRDFLESDCQDLIFLDADVSWDPQSLVQLCAYDVDVVGGVYPYRRESGAEEMPVRMKAGCFVPDERGLMEVEGLPTGFLRIRRTVLEQMAAASPVYMTERGEVTPVLFERGVLNGKRMGGDIAFCQKWRTMGGQLYAVPDMVLRHVGRVIAEDSLSAALRRQTGLTLRHAAELVRGRTHTTDTLKEAMKAVGNPWGASVDVLSLAVTLARQAKGPILEAGSGLTTVLMAAAAPDQTVWCLEHSLYYAARVEHMAAEAGISNIAVVTCPIKDGWYDLSEDMKHLPEQFAVGLVDGPPRYCGDRMRFFDVFGDRVDSILADDADDPTYAAKLTTWADDRDRFSEIDQRAAVILRMAA